MRNQLSIATFVAALVACCGPIGPVTAGEQVPFKGHLKGTVTVTPIVGDPTLDVHVEIDGAGNATQLGHFSVSIPHDVDRRPPPNPSVAVGAYIFTAADGDEVHADFSGESMLIAPGLLYIVESATITGGTGRFSGATGSFDCERWFDVAAGTTGGEFDGTISSVGSH